jgi:hypothetical protein
LGLLADISKPEPGLEDGQIIKDLRVHEVQETPQLLERVLDRCPRQEESVLRVELLQLSYESAIPIFDALTLVNHEILELEMRESRPIQNTYLVRRNDDRKVVVVLLGLAHARLPQVGPMLLTPVVQ